MAALDPFVELRRLGTHGRAVAVPGPHGRRGRQREQPLPDRVDDRREVRERTPGGPRPAREQRVPGEDGAQRGRVQADRARRVPGVCSTVSSMPATDRVCPSASSPSGARSGWVCFHSGRSSGCSRTGAPVRAASAGAASMWSLWACVHTMATSRRSPTAAAMASASWAASMTTASVSSPTIQTLLSTSQVPPSRLNVPEVTRWSMRAAIRRPPPSAARRRGASARRPSRPRPGRSSR